MVMRATPDDTIGGRTPGPVRGGSGNERTNGGTNERTEKRIEEEDGFGVDVSMSVPEGAVRERVAMDARRLSRRLFERATIISLTHR